MKQQIINQVIAELEQELTLRHQANTRCNDSARFSAAQTGKQRDTTGFEAAHLARGHARQHQTLTRQIETLRQMKIENFAGQEIDIGALVEVEIDTEPCFYFLLDGGGGKEITINGQVITVVTPESPIGQALMGEFDCAFFSFRPGMEGLILNVS